MVSADWSSVSLHPVVEMVPANLMLRGNRDVQASHPRGGGGGGKYP